MNIYIANLSYTVTDNDLRELFSPFGEVTSAKVIEDRETGRSRGFGFVEMANNDEAQRAISELNNAMYGGKAISVNEARPKTDRPKGGGGGYGGGGGNRGGGGGYGGGGGNRGGGGGGGGRNKSW